MCHEDRVVDGDVTLHHCLFTLFYIQCIHMSQVFIMRIKMTPQISRGVTLGRRKLPLVTMTATLLIADSIVHHFLATD